MAYVLSIRDKYRILMVCYAGFSRQVRQAARHSRDAWRPVRVLGRMASSFCTCGLSASAALVPPVPVGHVASAVEKQGKKEDSAC